MATDRPDIIVAVDLGTTYTGRYLFSPVIIEKHG